MKKLFVQFIAPILLIWLIFSVSEASAQVGKGFSGEFDALVLGVDGQTHLTGFYSDGTGEDRNTGKPMFTCQFAIEGDLADGKYKIETYYPGDEKVIRGELKFSGEGEKTEVFVKLESEHGGCANVNPFSRDGANFLLLKRGDWTAVAVVKAAKTYFYDSPDAKSKRRAYLVKNDFVHIFEKRGDWINVEFAGEKITRGWIKKADLYNLRFPAAQSFNTKISGVLPPWSPYLLTFLYRQMIDNG